MLAKEQIFNKLDFLSGEGALIRFLDLSHKDLPQESIISSRAEKIIQTNKQKMAAKLKPSDFDLANATPIGAGALSYVLRAEHLKSKRIVAVKVLSKVQLLQQGKVEAAVLEKDCLYELGPHPFIARLLGTGQSDDELYFFPAIFNN